MNIEINNKNDLIKILDNEKVNIFKVKYSNRENPFNNYEKLIKSYKINFFKLAIEALSSNQHFWQVGNILIYLIPYSELGINRIIEFFKLSYGQNKESSHHFRISKKISEVNIETSKKLLSVLLKEDELYVIPHIAAISVTQHNEYKISQFENIMCSLKHGKVIEIKYAMNYLAQYNFSKNEYILIFEELKKISVKKDKELDSTLIYNSYDLIEKGYENFLEIILLYIENNDIDIKYHLSQVLHYASKNHIEKDWFKKTFLSIIDIDIEQQNILYNLESILNIYLEKDDYDFIKKFLYTWVEKGNLSSLYEKITLHTFDRDFNKYKRFSQFITEALVYENSELHKILPKLILEKELTLDIEVMESLTIDDYLYLCRKILGYFYEFEIMNSMLFSILSVKKLSKEVRQIIISILVDYIGQEYQHNILEFLENLEDSTLNENEKEAKKIVVLKLTEKKEKRKKLPKLKELLPTQQQNRIISRVQGVAMQKAMAESEKDSFWSQFATRIPICCGRGWFSEFQGTFTEVSYMKSHSHSITMPSSSQSQPINYEFDRFQFRIAEKGK